LIAKKSRAWLDAHWDFYSSKLLPRYQSTKHRASKRSRASIKAKQLIPFKLWYAYCQETAKLGKAKHAQNI